MSVVIVIGILVEKTHNQGPQGQGNPVTPLLIYSGRVLSHITSSPWDSNPFDLENITYHSYGQETRSLSIKDVDGSDKRYVSRNFSIMSFFFTTQPPPPQLIEDRTFYTSLLSTHLYTEGHQLTIYDTPFYSVVFIYLSSSPTLMTFLVLIKDCRLVSGLTSLSFGTVFSFTLLGLHPCMYDISL